MGINFRKSVKVAPGVKLNLSKKGVGVRVGTKHAGISTSSRGTRASASIPGTGISYSTKIAGAKRKNVSNSVTQAPTTYRRPVPLRWWFIALAALFLVAGIGCIFTDFTAAILSFAIFAIMAVCTIKKLPARNNAPESGNKEE